MSSVRVAVGAEDFHKVIEANLLLEMKSQEYVRALRDNGVKVQKGLSGGELIIEVSPDQRVLVDRLTNEYMNSFSRR
jgi:hypothetical protein